MVTEKTGDDLNLDSAHAVRDEHKSKGIMADINQKFVCSLLSIMTQLFKKDSESSCWQWSSAYIILNREIFPFRCLPQHLDQFLTATVSLYF